MFAPDYIYLTLLVGYLLLIVSVGTVAVICVWHFISWALKMVATVERRGPQRVRIPRAIVASERWRT